MKPVLFAMLSLFIAIPSVAQEFDLDAAESAFRRCKSCHQIADGEEVIERGGRTGPNLFGIIGRTAGTAEGFRYSDGLIAAGEAGLVWTEQNLLEYVAAPSEFLRELTGDSSFRSKMTPQRLRDDGPDLAAWLASMGDSAENTEAEPETPSN